MSNSTGLAGKTAIVTGASSGIGRAIAAQLGAAGAHVFLSGRTAEAMQDCAAQIVDQGGQASVVVGDVTQPGVLQTLVDQAVAETGHLHIMVNNACLLYTSPSPRDRG